ncbi:MAG: hypothetical protein LBK52_03055 [Deltaproteobacteria bacterium]|jgi:hypothetical protein|nr:hypothetical protein [Deltaproteobacteria bacterium]
MAELGALLWLILIGLPAPIPGPAAADIQPEIISPLPARPRGLAWPEPASSRDILKAFLGVPYRIDGTISDQGTWTVWANPEKTFSTPGLNCSGLAAGALRFSYGRSLRLEDLRRDRDNNSGPGSVLGLDWDFGLDVVLNLAEGHFLRFLPQPEEPPYAYTEFHKPAGWGLNIHTEALEQTLAQFDPRNIYLFAVSKPDRRFKGGLSYYHVGLIQAETSGEIWLYHATHNAGVHRLNLAGPKGLASFRRYFPPVRNGERRIIFLELEPPPADFQPAVIPGL